MLIFTRRLGVAHDADAHGTLRLTWEWRCKSRCRVRVAETLAGHPAWQDGTDEVGLDLPRGAVLREGDLIATGDGGVVLRVHAAVEQVLQVVAADALALARIAYHLGNRHVPVQVGGTVQAGWLRLPLDHVLEDMVTGLGGNVQVVSAPFDPESGAYAGHGHAPRIHDFLDAPPR